MFPATVNKVGQLTYKVASTTEESITKNSYKVYLDTLARNVEGLRKSAPESPKEPGTITYESTITRVLGDTPAPVLDVEEHLQLTLQHVRNLSITTELMRRELVTVGVVFSKFSAVVQKKHSTLLGLCGYLQQSLAPTHDQAVKREEGEEDSHQ